MNIEQLMTDLDTGDASMADVLVKEANGQINYSSAVFEYARLLDMLPPQSGVVQEAASAASDRDLPTNPDEAGKLATAATARELIAFYDIVVNNAKKVKTAADRDLKVIIGLGKHYGISTSAAQEGNFMIAFAKPLAQALVREYQAGKKNSIPFAPGVFPNHNDAEKIMFAYGNSMARLAAVYGMSIGDCINDPTVQEELGLDKALVKALAEPQTGFDQGGVPDCKALYKALMKGAGMTVKDKVGTVTNAKVDDIAALITYTYVVQQVSAGVVASASKVGRKGAQKFVDDLCGAEEMRHNQSGKVGQKRISGTFQKINDNMQEWADTVTKTADQVVKVFSDAVAALGKVAKGETKGITTEYYSDFD